MQKRLAQMIRVDHAGEHGAVKIYEGQAMVFDKVPSKAATADLIRHMAAQEQEHLDTFDALLLQRKIRPTAFAPLWAAAGFSLGAVTALMGEKAAMACTAAVEEVIDDHYAAQLEELAAHNVEPELCKTIAKFRADEAEHRHTALAHGAEDAPAYTLLSGAIKTACRAAIKISEKI